MHMKHLLKIKSAAAILCAVVLLCGCNNEIRTGGDPSGGEEGEFTTVNLSVGLAAGEQTLVSKGLTDGQENAIHNLYILAFQPDEAGDHRLRYYATGRSGTGGNGQFNFTLRRSVSGAADTKLLLIANQNPYSLINTGMTYEEVQTALTSSELMGGPAFADTGIPMFGFAGNNPGTLLEITEGMTLSANLLRAVARVDVGVGTYKEATGEWDKGNVDFELTEIYVFKPQNRYTLIPLTNNLEYINDIPSVTAPSPVGEQSTTNFQYTITNNTSCKAEIYIPEVLLMEGTVYDTNHEERIALVIGGTHKSKKNYYRIDFTTARTNAAGTPLHDVLRNHIYRYSITNVSQAGYTTAGAAYSGKPVGLNLTVDIVDWQAGVESKPNANMLVNMNFGGINGAIKTGTMKENGVSKEFTVKEKTDKFVTDDWKVKPGLRYNNLIGEAADNLYNGTFNGGLYTGVQDAFSREGPYAKLVIAPDNATEAVMWRSTPKGTPKKDRVLDAKKACLDYRGQGRSDWRLPRLSELCLLWLNRVSINQSKGFTSLGVSSVTYWTGTEGGKNDKAYAVNAAGEITLNEKTKKFSVRCVREIR